MSRIQQVGWSLGNHCNARCGHCYSWTVREGTRTITWDDALRVLDQLEALQIRTVNLGGNEPIFTHGPTPETSMLPRIIRAATDRGMVVGVTTNGTTALILARLDPEAFARVGEWHVSIDSALPREHDRNRGGPFFALARKAMQRIRAAEKPLTLITCAMGWNSSPEHVAALFSLAREVGADVRINTMKATEAEHDDLVLSPERYQAFFREVLRWSTPTVVGEPALAAMWGVPGEGCPCGTQSMRINSITPDGRVPVSPCVFLHELRFGDALKDDLTDLIDQPAFRALQLRRERMPSSCQTRACGFEASCRGGCAARAVLSGAPETTPTPADNPGIDPTLWQKLDQRDPYCPADLADKQGGLPALPCALVVPQSALRVHGGYLCTVIASPRAEPAWTETAAQNVTEAAPGQARSAPVTPLAAWRKEAQSCGS